jgi:hypothetical protein
MKRQWIKFRAEDIADLINRVGREGADDGILTPEKKRDGIVLRDFLFGDVPPKFVATPRTVGNRLKAHRDEPVKHGGELLVLRGDPDRNGVMVYFVHFVRDDNEPAAPEPKGNAGHITIEMKDKLKRRGFSDDDIFDMSPQRARDILAEPNRSATTERFRVVGQTSDSCLVCFRIEDVKLIKDTRSASHESKPLHLHCAPTWFDSDDNF